ncbi:MAG: phosphate acyltransferase PlsX [Abditibacteriaceae bacterium]
MRIAIDAMGGDNAPGEIVSGALAAARELSDIEVLLVGDQAAMEKHVEGVLPPNVHFHHTPDVVEMGEAPSQALRKKNNSSLAVATKLVADGLADTVLSAGNTGAFAAFALFRIGRIKGVDRPGIATVFPSQTKPVVVLDTGANANCKAGHLAEFAVMGAAYARGVTGIIPGTESFSFSEELPTVGLLSIGEEEGKGNDLTKSAYKLLQDNAAHGKYQFHGNVEGRDLSLGTTDVIVCDGFVGNVVLKVAEGIAKMVTESLRESLTSSWRGKLGALLLAPSLRRFKKKVDYTGYGGAMLLGLNAICVICHGSSNARSIQSAIRIAQHVVKANVVEDIRQAFSEEIPEIKAHMNGQSSESVAPPIAL